MSTPACQVSAQSNVDGRGQERTISIRLGGRGGTNATILNVGALLSLSNLLSLDATLIQSTLPPSLERPVRCRHPAAPRLPAFMASAEIRLY
ncbi:MAG: hypothetical protein U0992_07765 [Planctomycetaceae bacterium]